MSIDPPCSTSNRRGRGLLLAAVLTLLIPLGLSSGSAEAGLVAQVGNATVSAGGSGTFDVVLINTGGTFQVSGFSVELSVAGNLGVLFTSVSEATTVASYIFGTLQAPPFSFTSFPNIDFIASDSSMTFPGFVTLNTPGQVVGLEHVGFSVAPGTTSGRVPVTMVIGNNTMISDVSGNPLGFSAVNGAITISGSAAVPEPSTLVASAIASTFLSLVLLRRRLLGREGSRRAA